MNEAFIVTSVAATSFQLWFSIAIVIFAIVLYASEKTPMEVSSIIIIAILLVFFYYFPVKTSDGELLLNTEKLLAGFASPALITVTSLLILGQSIIQTGALNDVASYMLRFSNNSAKFAFIFALIFTAFVSAFLNNTPVVVIFIPIIVALAKATGLGNSKMMMPLSFASILGGLTTLVGSSTNLLVSGAMQQQGLEGLSFFEFTGVGLLIATPAMIYVTLILPLILPENKSASNESATEDDKSKFISHYELSYSSEFVGTKIQAGHLQNFPNIMVRIVQRGEHLYLPPFDAEFTLKPKDVLILSALKKDIADFFTKNPNVIDDNLTEIDEEYDKNIGGFESDVNMAEIVVNPASRFVGKTLEQIGFGYQHKCVVMGIKRQARTVRSNINEVRLKPGDVLLVLGRSEKIMGLHNNPDFMLLEWTADNIHSGKRAKLAVSIFLCVMAIAACGILPIAISSMVGVMACLLFKCVNLRQAGRAIDMNIILIIATSLALGTSLNATGGDEFIARNLVSLFDGASGVIVISCLFLIMMVMTNILSNNATAVLFTPIAISMANQLGIDYKLFIYAVIFACNCSFITPIGYQTNLMVMSPGNYKFKDFIKGGTPVAIILWLSYSIYVYFKLHI